MFIVVFCGSCLHFDHLDGKEGAGCFAFLWFVACVLPGLSALPLGEIDRQSSVIVTLSVHNLYYFNNILPMQ